jgi:hypothetical protein
MKIFIEYDVDFVRLGSGEDPKTETCCKCAFRQNGRCIKRIMAACRFGESGYFVANSIREADV